MYNYNAVFLCVCSILALRQDAVSVQREDGRKEACGIEHLSGKCSISSSIRLCAVGAAVEHAEVDASLATDV